MGFRQEGRIARGIFSWRFNLVKLDVLKGRATPHTSRATTIFQLILPSALEQTSLAIFLPANRLYR